MDSAGDVIDLGKGGDPPARRVPSPGKPVARVWARLGYLVHDVSRMRRTVFDRQMKPLGITRSQWWVLANLSRHDGDGMMQTELARVLGVGKVTVGGLIDRLEEAGYVRRKADKNDRRAKRVFITKAGYALIEEMATHGESLTRLFCAGLTLEEIALTEAVLAKIKVNLSALLGDTSDIDGEEDVVAG